MPIEWVIIGAALGPHIKKFVEDRAKKLAEKGAEAAWAKVYKSLIPEEKLVKANEAWRALVSGGASRQVIWLACRTVEVREIRGAEG